MKSILKLEGKDAAIPSTKNISDGSPGGSFSDPPGPLEDPLEGLLEENLEAPDFPPRHSPACFFCDIQFI